MPVALCAVYLSVLFYDDALRTDALLEEYAVLKMLFFPLHTAR